MRLFRTDQEALKRKLIDEARARGEKPTPKQIDQQLMGIERSEAALRVVEAVEAAGGQVFYHALDLRDGDAVSAAIDDIRQRYGRIDVLLHAGGLLIDRILPNKEPHQFDLVFDVKADGFFSLLRAAKGMNRRHRVLQLGSRRFGNNGQSDYAAANDLLCKISTRCVPGDQRRAGSPSTGQPGGRSAWPRAACPADHGGPGRGHAPARSWRAHRPPRLTYGGTRRRIVVAGRLGAWLEERDPTGGLDPVKMAAALAARQPRFLMVSQVKAARLYGGIVAWTTSTPGSNPSSLTPPDPDTPWLPGVMVIEALAEVANLLAPGYDVAAVAEHRNARRFQILSQWNRVRSTSTRSLRWSPMASA